MPKHYPTPDRPVPGALYAQYVRAYRAAGWKVGVVAPLQRVGRRAERPLLSKEPWIEYDEDGGVPVYRDYTWVLLNRLVLTRAPFARKWRVGIATRVFGKYFAAHGHPDLIHAHNCEFAGIIAAEVKRRYGIPYVLTEHNTKFQRGLVKASDMPLIRNGYRSADARATVSPQLGRILEAAVGDVVRPWTWVPDMVDGAFFRPAPNHPNRPDAPFRFLNVARMVEQKGQADLLAAFALRFKGDSTVQLCLGGAGPLRVELEKRAGALGISEQVVFLGLLDRRQVLAEMQAADVYVLSSHHETFGIPLIEALACGKPVVATACGGPECIVNAEDGFLVAPGNPEELAGAMAAAKAKAASFRPARLRQDCLDRFGRDAVVRRLEKIYEDVLAARHGAN